LFQALKEESIRSHLLPAISKMLSTISILDKTSSTNETILSFPDTPGYQVLLAESQSQGKGRRDKSWISPYGKNIYLSIRFTHTFMEAAQFIPLITGLAIANALRHSGFNNCKVKWPNDIYLNKKKLGGVLIESSVRQHVQELVVGIGLNINMDVNADIDQQWTSLVKATEIQSYDRNIIVAHLLNELIPRYNQLDKFKFDSFFLEWSKHDYLRGKTINVIEEQQTFEALVKGLGRDGSLIVSQQINDHQVCKNIYSADISVKTTDV
jgi:BirA family biotin operon repressor/biotin-[acetyl-CoA-carboxylase] ligase